MATNKQKPELLNVPQMAEIHLNHPPTGKAIQLLVEYINKTVAPQQGNKIKPSRSSKL